jgi:hypothetical protein
MKRRGRLPAFIIDVALVFCVLLLVYSLAVAGSAFLALVLVAIPLGFLLLFTFFPRAFAAVPVRASARRPSTRAPPLF